MTVANVNAASTQIGVRHTLELKETGNTTTVRDDCRTKLMYYLSCFAGISKFCEVHKEWIKYTKYEECASWTLEEEEELHHICNDVITADVAKNIGFIEAPRELIRGQTNRFYDVTNTDEVLLNHVHVHIDENSIYAARLSIGAKNELKFKVMLYEKNWIHTNYYTPLILLGGMIERHREDKKRRLHNEEVLKDKTHYCCVVTKREKVKHLNLIKFVIILYFIQSVALLYVYIKGHKPDVDDDDYKWVKWVNLAAILLSIINVIFGVISVILVCISCCVENWIAYVRMIINFMMCSSALCVPLSLFMRTYDIVLIIQTLIAVTITSFSCVINEGSKVNPAFLCICCGKKTINYDKIHYYL